MLRSDPQQHDQPASLSRRRAIKTGAAIAVGTAVWTEPTIKGLARRPAYAATGSGAPIEFNNFSLMLAKGDSFDVIGSDGTTVLTISRSGQTLTFALSTSNSSLNGALTIVGGSTTMPTLVNEPSPYTVSANTTGNAIATVSGSLSCP